MMVDGDAPRPWVLPDFPLLPPPLPPPRNPEFRQVFDDYIAGTVVSTINRVLTKNAKKLYIYDPGNKLQHIDTYDIGGTQAEIESQGGSGVVPEFWFFFTTTQCPGKNYLLNLFVCHRLTGNFGIGICNSNDLVEKKVTSEKPGTVSMSDTLTWLQFRSTQPDENFYIKSFNFNEQQLKTLNSYTLVVPIKIKIKPVKAYNNEVIKRIKLNHQCSDVLAKNEPTDFVLKSASGKEYPVHKFFLAAYSKVLRDIIKSKSASSDNNYTVLDLSDYEIEMLLQFLYTGTIKDIQKEDCFKLLRIADQFELQNLFSLTQHAICDQIDVNNAIDIARLSEIYKLDKLQAMVFNFIKSNPKVLETDGWKNLDDVHLAKKLFQFMQSKRD